METNISPVMWQTQFFGQKFRQPSGCVIVHFGRDLANRVDVYDVSRIKCPRKRQCELVLKFANHQLLLSSVASRANILRFAEEFGDELRGFDDDVFFVADGCVGVDFEDWHCA
jgi:hypothetical protein